MVRAKFDKLRHLRSDDNLRLNLKLRLYQSSVCSILTYGSEVWYLTTTVKRELNGANSQMMSILTVKTQCQESSKKSPTFDLIKLIYKTGEGRFELRNRRPSPLAIRAGRRRFCNQHLPNLYLGVQLHTRG